VVFLQLTLGLFESVDGMVKGFAVGSAVPHLGLEEFQLLTHLL
jgi:hypothetical protein